VSDLDDLVKSGGTDLIVFGMPSSAKRERPQNLREVHKEIASDPSVDIGAPGVEIRAHVVSSSRIRKNLDKALDALKDAFESSVGKKVGDLELEEIEVGLELSTDGKVGIPGIGVTISGKSSVVVRFKKKR
jgi:hypothetical protein